MLRHYKQYQMCVSFSPEAFIYAHRISTRDRPPQFEDVSYYAARLGHDIGRMAQNKLMELLIPQVVQKT